MSEVLSFNKKTILVIYPVTKQNSATFSHRIDSEIRKSIERNIELYDIKFIYAARIGDIRRNIVDYKPNIIHFFGTIASNESDDGFLIDNYEGNSKEVSTEELSKLFRLCSELIDCVIIHAPNAKKQASIIAKHIDYVIGIDHEIKDNETANESIIEFSAGFYDALIAKRSIDHAFEIGLSSMKLLYPDEKSSPIFIHQSIGDLRNSHAREPVKREYSFKKKDTIVVGFTYDAPMFYINNDNDTIEGFAYELGENIVKEINKIFKSDKKFEPRIINYSIVDQKIESGEIDIAIGGFVPGEMHGKNLRWSKSYLDANFCLVVPKDWDLQIEDDSVEGLGILNSLTIGVYDEPSVKKWISEYLPNACIKAYSYPRWFDCIKNKEVDVIINDYPYAVESMKHYGGELKFASYRLSQSAYGYAIGSHINNDSNDIIDAALSNVMGNKEFWISLHKRYLNIKDYFLRDKYKLQPYRPYITMPGDNISSIAKRFLGSESRWEDIFALNKHVLPNPHLVDEGITIYIPINLPNKDAIKKADEEYMRFAIDMARKGMANGEGGPFGAVVVKDGAIVGKGNNKVTSTNDPTAHAEVVAIRDACKNLNSFQLDGCTIYTSCEPCPMCLGAIYWARPSKVFYGCDRVDAANIDFDDNFIYQEIRLPISKRKIKTIQILQEEAIKVFKEWSEKQDRIEY